MESKTTDKTDITKKGIREQLWADVYSATAKIRTPSQSIAFPKNMADKALAEYDERFKETI